MDSGVRALRPVPVAVQMQTVAVEAEALDTGGQHVEHLEPVLELGEPGVVPEDFRPDK